MKAGASAFRLADLGVTRSHNRAHTSNDNRFSESHFKTLKYQPRFPRPFGCSADAKAFCRQFFDWYNQERHHTGIGLMTPDHIHYGQADSVTLRDKNPARACRDNLGRFVAKPPGAWINPPSRRVERQP